MTLSVQKKLSNAKKQCVIIPSSHRETCYQNNIAVNVIISVDILSHEKVS